MFQSVKRNIFGPYAEVRALKGVRLKKGSRYLSRGLNHLEKNIWVLYGHCLKKRSLEQYLNTFFIVNNLYRFKHTEVWIVGAAKWLEILFKRPDSLNKV